MNAKLIRITFETLLAIPKGIVNQEMPISKIVKMRKDFNNTLLVVESTNSILQINQ